ncbi:hypothetical protein AQUCO_03700113v1 [Aquilegia coerulea]|uniref:At1g61320/AtMIF1 LRR domain-containing protein n=1 Tax=Aquilegia coerulea TaxID=218851 RepID=A0A2G5CUM8_AQUCA|nr:hypothetical protein AQUCO_03700113v1 [Aquilegia coerulea]
MVKRKRTQRQHFHARTRTVYTKFGLWEVDKIIEAMESRNLINRRTDIFSKCAIFENNKNMVDHISILPDDVLQYIISMLTMRKGASTCILSSRWRNLWSSSVSCLNFDAVNMIGRNYFHKKINVRRTVLDKKRRRFIKWVNQILHLRQGARINSLRICYFLGKESTSDIDQWVDLAAAQGVHELIIDLDLTKFGLVHNPTKLYKFPFGIFANGNGSTLMHLHLEACVFKLPQDFKSFNSLLSLSLERTSLTREDLRNILSNCSSLEWLSIRHCQLHTTSLKFEAPSLHLKHLAIIGCYNSPEIEVEAINLISFEYEGRAAKISFKNGSRVVNSYLGFSHEVTLNGVSYALNKLSSNLPCLETLFLTRVPSTSEENILPAKLPTFTNLKLLVFSVLTESRRNLLELISLLGVCPSLQKLELDLFVSCESEDVQTKVSGNSGSFHGNLKEIDIYGFRGYQNEIELAKCLLKYAHALEKMGLYTNIPRFYCGSGEWTLYQKIERAAGIPLNEVRKLLQKEALSTTRLIISSGHL